MPMDVDFIAGQDAIDELTKLLVDQPHGKREQIADEIIEFVTHMQNKWGVTKSDKNAN